ncbi:LexA family transcriptional regulator [Robertkochia aurantiaca]|uniref:LexA family transcriptional regulator n=1 Tax=Robertkochia aurantiaca TaxID=2873700 RepID=UPI001CCFEF86|nr:LexA family transcriptional regulator [Robertkochia sp. 3YJGBD-33]
MKQSLATEVIRFREVREELGLTQQAFAEELSLKNSTADIERGKTKLSGTMVTDLLDKYRINPLWLYGKSNQKYLDMQVNTSPRVVTVDPENNDNIVLVNVRAAAGYPHNIGDVDWYEELPAFSIPLPEYRNATYRGFQVEGDSMLPSLHPGEWVIGKAVESLEMLDNNTIAVVVLQDSVLVKKVQKHEDHQQVSLISLNTEYPPVVIGSHEIQELWQVSSKISVEIDKNPEGSSLDQIQQSILELRNEINALKK